MIVSLPRSQAQFYVDTLLGNDPLPGIAWRGWLIEAHTLYPLSVLYIAQDNIPAALCQAHLRLTTLCRVLQLYRTERGVAWAEGF